MEIKILNLNLTPVTADQVVSVAGLAARFGRADVRKMEAMDNTGRLDANFPSNVHYNSFRNAATNLGYIITSENYQPSQEKSRTMGVVA